MAHKFVRKVCNICGMEIGSKVRTMLCPDHQKQMRLTQRQRQFLEAVRDGDVAVGAFVDTWKRDTNINFTRAYEQVVTSLKDRDLLRGGILGYSLTEDGVRALAYNLKG